MPEKVPNQFQEFKRAQPIPSGGLKLLFAIFIIAGALIAGAITIYTAMESAHPGIAWLSAVLSGAIWLGLFIFSLWTAFSFFQLEPAWPGAWLKRYWRNNVIGRDAFIHLDKKENCQIDIVKRGKAPKCNPGEKNQYVICLNLGGWFNSSPNLFWDLGRKLDFAEYWRISLKRFCFYHETLTVKVCDDDGNAMVLEAKYLLKALAHHDNKGFGRAGNLVTLFRHFLEYSEHKYSQWREADEYAAEVKERLRLAFDTIKVTIEDLDDTRRFIKSKEAQEIRESLNARFEEIFPPLPKSQAA